MTQRHIFLLDGCGALLSAALLWVLGMYEGFFGLPAAVAHGLMLLPIAFAIYSFTCYALPFSGKRLRVIAVANLLYTAITFFLLFTQPLTMYGIAYFIGEKFIVIPLAVWEWKKGGRKMG